MKRQCYGFIKKAICFLWKYIIVLSKYLPYS